MFNPTATEIGYAFNHFQMAGNHSQIAGKWKLNCGQIVFKSDVIILPIQYNAVPSVQLVKMKISRSGDLLYFCKISKNVKKRRLPQRNVPKRETFNHFAVILCKAVKSGNPLNHAAAILISQKHRSMTRIIPLSPIDTTTADRLALAAWQFTRAVLWAEQPISKGEEQRAVTIVKEHLLHPAITETSFTCFCERILLAREAQLTGGSGYLPQPSVWLHPGYGEGYGSTQRQYMNLQQKRSEVAGYREAYSVLAMGYYKYNCKMRRTTFNRCRRKLLQHKAYGLLSLLYRATIYANFSL